MDRHQSLLVEQLHNAQFRQRKAILQLQADTTRLLSDLVDVRQERDTFREETARVRIENTELRNRLEEALTTCQDLKRERATLVRSASTSTSTDEHSAPVRDSRITNTEHNLKILTTLPVLSEGQTESLAIAGSSGTTDTTMKKAPSPKLLPHMYRELPDPLKVVSPRPDWHAVSTVVTARNH